MGLLKFFTPKADPVVSWSAEAGLVTEFDFDFDNQALCGIKPGDPAALLWKLGPTEDKAAEGEGNCNYYTKGIQAAVENERVSSFILFWNDKEQKRFLSFSSPCSYHGQKIELRGGMGEAEMTKVFGEPYWRDEDENEIILFYEFGEVEWEVEIDRSEGLTAIVVVTPPLLRDEEQRKAYKVNKPWPFPQIT